MQNAKLLLLPCLLLLAVTLPHLEQGDFRRDTGRYAAVGHYMWSGPSVWKPYLNPETPYFNKPPLAILIHGAFLKAFGVHVAVARIPSVLAALGVVSMSVLAVRLLGSRAEALASGIVLALTYEFFRRTREISLDLWQLFFVTIAVYLVLCGGRTDRKWLLVIAGIALGLALLCKPLLALATLPILAAWLVLIKRSRWVWLLFMGTLPLALLVAFPWHFAMWNEYGAAFLQQYFGQQVVDRARGRLSVNPPYYFASLIARTYWPWAILLAFALWHRFRPGNSVVRKPGRDLVLLGGIWSATVFILISVFPDKKVNYALPLYPMLSWVAAAGICRLPWCALRSWYEQRLRGLAPAAAGVLILASLLPIQFQKGADQNWQALSRWLKSNGLSAENLSYVDLRTEDICQCYLKNGGWPKPATSRLPGTEKMLILTRLTQNMPTEQELLFQSGPLAVVRASPGK